MDDQYRRRTLLGVLALGVASVLAGCSSQPPSSTGAQGGPSGRALPPGPAPSLPPIPQARPGAGEVVFHGPLTHRRIALTVDDGTAADVVAGYVEFAQRAGIHL